MSTTAFHYRAVGVDGKLRTGVITAENGKTVARELIRQGYTERAVTGFRSRAGRSFRAHLALSQTDEGRWRVEFDEVWAREGVKPPDAAESEAAAASSAAA